MAPDLLRLRSVHHPAQVPMLVDGVGSITYAEWADRSDSVAHGLVRLGVRRGDRVGLLFGGMDWLDYAVAYFAVLKAGGTAVHLAASLPAPELDRRLAQCGPVGVVCGAGADAPSGFAGWTTSVDALDRGDRTPVQVEIGPDDIADIIFTSGTTGPAKAFSNPHGNLSFGRGPANVASFDGASPLLAPMPLGTPSSAGTVGMFALTTSSTVVLCRVDDPERMAELIAGHRIGSVMLTPWIAMRMAAARVHERHDLSTVTTIGIASAPLPARIATELLTMMPNAVISTAYAQGEAVPAVVLNTYDPARPRSVGRPGPGTELRVVDEQGRQVEQGRIGEIWLRAAAPKRLYLDPELNRQVHADGWTRTRDLGYLGPDGDLYLFDRGTDVIRRHGELVSSIEVEEVLYRHPAVAQAAVIGVPDPEAGQAVVAVVVLTDPEAESALPDFLAERLAPHQRPSAVHVVADLPRGITGKVLKHRLRPVYSARP
ncbi:class I adenylate-forming enzyme family protein [Sphaerimonospora sp. CA-214678]|uniref:class I adenylate-forming enzyme family protein n=1 Tax=Sphaerimonospora sp. CA-214678 TaxID=3240029 RepID=UPI003D9474A8